MLISQIQQGPGGARKDTLLDKTTGKTDDRRMISEAESPLDRLIREGARKMLQSALDNEVAEFIERMKSRRTEDGLREIVRNGHSPERDIISRLEPFISRIFIKGR
jgi:hypothetical protein